MASQRDRDRYKEGDLISSQARIPGDKVLYRGETLLVKTEELLDTLALAAMRAEELAITSPEYEALADAVGYALDLADFAHAAEIDVFASLKLPGDW
jgi:protein involved in polysaccharide export with SLBB domain